MNNLVFVQFNANLMEKNKKRKARGVEVLLANDADAAQDWIVEDADEVEPGLPWDMVAEATGADEYLTPRRSDRSSRELFDEEFESENEDEEVKVEYESD